MTILWQLLSEIYAYVKALLKSKETVFWVVIFPIIMLVILSLVFANPDQTSVEIALLEEEDLFKEILGNISSIELELVGDEETMLQMLRNGSIQAGLVVRGSIEDGLSTKIYFLEGVQESELAASIIKAVINGVEEEIRSRFRRLADPFIPPNATTFVDLIIDPISTDMEEVEPEIYLDRGALTLVMVVRMVGVQILFIGLFSGVMMVIAKKQQGILKLIISSPITSLTLLVSDTLATFVSITVSTLSILAGGLILGADYSLMTMDKALLLISIGIIGSLFMTGLGLILSLLPKTIEGATALVNMIAFPLMFLGGILVPYTWLPPYIRDFAESFPVSRLINTMMNILIYDVSIYQVLNDLVIVSILSIAIYLVGVLVYRRLMEIAIEEI